MPRPPVRVLTADDSAAVRRLLADEVGGVPGVEVVAQAADGAAALAAVQAHRPGVVVLDVQMPGMGGLPALRSLRALGPRPRVIVLTNHTADAYRQSCLAAGADHFFDTPTEVDRALNVLRAWAAGGGA